MAGAVIFDLDGTLVDSAPEIHDAVNQAVSTRGLAPFSLPEIISFVGKGLPNLIRLVMAARDIAETEFSALHDEVLALYNAADGSLTTAYPGVNDLLVALRSEGVALGICTNKPEEAARHVLHLQGWGDVFDCVIGGDSLPTRKPDPAPLLHVRDALGQANVLYVGDSEVDAETAQAAGLPFALFPDGYRKTPVDQIAHDHLFSHHSELLPLALQLVRKA